ncbi:MAG: hypothetical protein HKN32_09285, partial [Flavobacteriales bacterium]|nr:hypothetical protein [Flavobacteriales bacterium]
MARRELPEINAGSMADIAFLLLVFFLMVTTIESEKGILRQLPPPLPPDIDIPDVRERDVFVVLVNSRDKLLVENRPMKIDQLKDAAKDFIIADGVFQDLPIDESLPLRRWIKPAEVKAAIQDLEGLKSQTDDEERKKDIEESIDKLQRKLDAIEVFGKPYKELPGSALISMQNDNATSYDMYIQVQNELQSAVNELRDELAMEYYGMLYGELEEAYERDRENQDLKGRLYT